MRTLTLPVVAALAICWSLAASAQTPAPIESAYSTIDVYTAKKSCRKLGGGNARDDAEGEVWRCPGVAGVEVYLLYQDARDFLSYGRRGKRETNVFGAGGPIGGIRETLEWRGRKDAKGALQPFATIARMAFENRNVDRADWWSLLIVTRLAPALKDSCVIGYVDARANSDANEIARRVADQWAADAARPCPTPDDVSMVGKIEAKWKERKTVEAP